MTAASHTQGETGDVPALRRRLAADLEAARARTRALTHDVFAVDDADFTRQHSPLMSPFHWDVAHIANMEDYWLVRRGAPDAEETAGVREDLDQYYDAFTNPRAGRPQLPLLSPAEARAYGDQVREKALAHLEAGAFDERRTLAGGFVFGMIVQHEQQHVETMLATHQLRDGAPVLHADPPPAPVVPGLAGTEILHPGAEFLMGTSDEPFALDNEKPAHPVRVDDFWLDAAPVTNAEFARFVDAGGYADRSLWSEAGWEHITGEGWHAPMTWEKVEDRWYRTSFGVREAIADVGDQPVLHVCFQRPRPTPPGRASACPPRSSGSSRRATTTPPDTTRRFPWGDEDPSPERANLDQRHLQPAPVGAYPAGASPLGVHQLIGDVWEWCDSGFEGYPGFEPFPYKEYSEVFFGGDFRMLRGSSFGVGTPNARTTFRNWDLPIRRQIFSGFRCARSA